MKKIAFVMISLLFAGSLIFSGCDCGGSEKPNDADIMNQLKDKDCDDCSKY